MNRYLLAACAVIVAVMMAVALWFQHKARVEKARAEAAVAQAQVEQKAREALETYTQQTIIVRERGNVAVQHIYDTPDASTPVPVGVLSAWRSGIDSVRGRPGAKPGDPPAVP